jgi:5'-nucleotidase
MGASTVRGVGWGRRLRERLRASPLGDRRAAQSWPSMPRAAATLAIARAALLAVAVLASGCAWVDRLPWKPAAAPVEQPLHVTLLHVNDVYQMSSVDQGRAGGVARLATLKRQIAVQNANVLFLLGGDTLSPSVASTLFKGRQMIDAWNAAGLDVAVLGNHEFDFGPAVLRERLAESRFVWLGANVIDRASRRPLVAPYTIKTFEGIKVGIVGVVTEDTPVTSKPGPGLAFEDAVAAARRAVGEMQAQGVRTIVALTHLPLVEDKALARAVPVVAILGGHEHAQLESVVSGVPIYKMGSDARLAGRIDLDIDRRTGKVFAIDFEALPVGPELKPDPAVQEVVARYEAAIAKDLDIPLGETTVPLDARQSTNRSRETNLGDLLADAYRTATGADVAIVNGGTIRSNAVVGPGKITRRSVLTMLPFENPVVKLEVAGATLRAALEHGLGRAEQLESGEFPQVSGMRVVYDDTFPPGKRLISVTVGGRPLDDAARYTLAVNTYLAGGGDGYAMLRGQRELIGAEAADIEPVIALRAFAAGPVSPEVDGRLVRRRE